MDPGALLYKKGDGQAARLSYHGHVLLDNRHGLVTNVCVTAATSTAERDAALLLAQASVPPDGTLGADNNFDAKALVSDLRAIDVTRHVEIKKYSAIDARTTRNPGYAVRQRKRKLVEQVFGWMKTVGGLRKLRHLVVPLVDWMMTFAAASYNLVRMRTLHVAARGRRTPANDRPRPPLSGAMGHNNPALLQRTAVFQQPA